MLSSSTPREEKIPGILLLFCISTGLGFLYNLSSVLVTSNQFQLFYACYLIFPIVELVGVYKRFDKVLFSGFLGAIALHTIEYAYAGYAYGFDKLFSLFGTNIAGYFISVAIWWSYFCFSKKFASYFNIHKTTSSKCASAQPASSPSPSVSISDGPTPLLSAVSPCSSDKPAPLSNTVADAPSRSNHPKRSIHAIAIILTVIFLAVTAAGFYQFILYQDSLSQIQSLLAENQSLTTENRRLQREVLDLQCENYSLQSAKNDYFVDAMLFSYLKNQIRFVLDDGTKLYHTYDCPIYQDYSGVRWIHNPEYCDYLGYSPCPLCSNP